MLSITPTHEIAHSKLRCAQLSHVFFIDSAKVHTRLSVTPTVGEQDKTKEKIMFLDTMLIEETQNTYELEGTICTLVHLWCGTCGVPTGTTGCSCYYLPSFVPRFKKLALNDYDEALTDYSTQTGYVIAPDPVLDQTPVHNIEPEINQPADDVLTWNGDFEGRMIQSSAKLEDRFHIETMQNLKTSCQEIEQFQQSRLGAKICKNCHLANPVVATSCIYCN